MPVLLLIKVARLEHPADRHVQIRIGDFKLRHRHLIKRLICQFWTRGVINQTLNDKGGIIFRRAKVKHSLSRDDSVFLSTQTATFETRHFDHHVVSSLDGVSGLNRHVVGKVVTVTDVANGTDSTSHSVTRVGA